MNTEQKKGEKKTAQKVPAKSRKEINKAILELSKKAVPVVLFSFGTDKTAYLFFLLRPVHAGIDQGRGPRIVV